MTKVTWDELVKAEPRLSQLEASVKAVDDSGPVFCANWVWVNQFKPVLVNLVGWFARDKAAILHTAEAYDIAYDHLYGLLPDCRNCKCGALG